MLSLRIALRYLLSKKSHGAINIISAISLAAIAVASAAMVIVMSVFNGFANLAGQKLSRIDPDLKIERTDGRAIENIDSLITTISAIEGVKAAQPQIQAQAFIIAPAAQIPVAIMGMTKTGLECSGIPQIVIDGNDNLDQWMSADSLALLSVGVAMNSGIRPADGIDRFSLVEPRRIGNINAANPLAAFRIKEMVCGGVFQVEQEEYDKDVIIIPYMTAAQMLAYDNAATSVSVFTQPGTSAAKVQQALATHLNDPNLRVLNRLQQEEQSFRLIAIEKWITFLMLAFILIIASCNIVSTLSMMILEKQPNMKILTAMGATRRKINAIFQSQGWLIVVLGGITGMILGALLVLGQQTFGWIKLQGSDPGLMSIDVYPVALIWSDLLITTGAILVVAILITPVIPLLRRNS